MYYTKVNYCLTAFLSFFCKIIYLFDYVDLTTDFLVTFKLKKKKRHEGFSSQEVIVCQMK